MPGTLTTPRDQTCPAQRTGQQPARARKTTSISSQNRMLRITVVLLLAGIVNRTTPISKQKMCPRGVRRRHQASGIRLQEKRKNRGNVPRSYFLVLFFFFTQTLKHSSTQTLFSGPYTLVPGPFFLFTQTLRHPDTQALYFSKMAIASISISASGFTRAFTTTPVAAGKPFLKYFLRTAAVSL